MEEIHRKTHGIPIDLLEATIRYLQTKKQKITAYQTELGSLRYQLINEPTADVQWEKDDYKRCLKQVFKQTKTSNPVEDRWNQILEKERVKSIPHP